ncbi:recombinase family protein [Amycolatopsis sp. NBC_00438]
MGGKLRILGAVRLSRATDESTSPARQRDRIEWWTSGNGGRVVHVAEDLDVSGGVSPFERGGLGEWLTDAQAKHWDVLVAWKLDRISRSAEDTLRLLRWCIDRDKRIVCVDDGIDSETSMGRVWIQLAAIFAEVERTAIKERTTGSREKLRQVGRWAGGAPVYGLRAQPREDGPGYGVYRDPEAYPHARYMVEAILAGKSLNSVAKELTHRGVLSPQDLRRQQAGRPTRGLKWNVSTVRSILTSDSLRGLMSHEGRPVVGPDGVLVKVGESIVSVAEWKQLQDRLVDGKGTRNRSEKTTPLLGVVFCSGCGARLYRQGATRRGKTYGYYKCATNVTGGDCDGRNIRAEILRDFTEEQLLSHIGDVEVTESVLIPGNDTSAALEEAEAALTELTLFAAQARSERAKSRIRAQMAALDQRIVELEQQPSAPDEWRDVGTGETYGQAWVRMDDVERRQLMLDSGVRVMAWTDPLKLEFIVPEVLLRRRVPGYEVPVWASGEG